MIRWSAFDQPTPEAIKRAWQEHWCPAAERLSDGSCLGYAALQDDDEPCEVCKACDKLRISYEHTHEADARHVATP